MLENKQTYNQRNLSMDVLRVLACLMVITLHVTAEGVYAAPSNVLITFHCMTAGAAPLFFMLSGAFTRGSNIRKYLVKALQMVILFVIFQALFTVSDCYFQYKTVTLSLVQELGITSFRICKYHLWYLPEYAAVLLVSPIINAAAEKNPSVIRYLCGLFFVYTMIPSLFSFAGIQWDISRKINELIPFHPLGYVGYFCLGRMLYDHFSALSDRKTKVRLTALILWIATGVAASLITIVRSTDSGCFDPSKVERFSPLIVFADTLLFIIFAVGSATTQEKTEEPRQNICTKTVAIIVPSALWIYLIHPFFMDLISDWGFNCQSFYPGLSVPLKVIPVFLLSLLFGLLANALIRLFRKFHRDRLLP